MPEEGLWMSVFGFSAKEDWNWILLSSWSAAHPLLLL
jgi:hypothetical protein